MVSELNDLQEPARVEISTKNAVKNGVKYAAMGAAVGLLLAVMICCVAFLLSDRVYSGRELKVRFGVTVLGGVPGGRKARGLDRWLMQKEDRVLPDNGDAYSLAAANLMNYAGGVGTVLVTGDAGSEVTREVCRGLQEHLKDVKLICSGSLLEDAGAARDLMQCDAVVLAEKCRVSRYARVAQQIERVLDCDRKLLGCVVMER